MKKYLLFAFSSYYPEGGVSDFIDSFDTIELAKKAARALWKNNRYTDNYQIVDYQTLAIIEEGVPKNIII